MAVTVINLSDPVSTLVTKTNTISSDIGDRAALTTPVGSNLVAAINEINTRLEAVDAASELATQVEAEFATSIFTAGGFSADSANIDSATITTLSGTSLNTNAISTVTMQLDSGDAPLLRYYKPLSILNSSGTVLKAGYLLSTSATDNVL